MNANFSQPLFARLPRTRFTHSICNPFLEALSTAPAAVDTKQRLHTASCQTRMAATQQHKIFAAPIGTATPKGRLHTASCRTRMAATHQRKIFAAPIGTATPRNIYTQQAAKPEWQRHFNTKFSQLLVAQLPPTTFTHSKLPNPHGSDAATQHFRSSYLHSYPE